MEFDKWRKENEEIFKEKFLDIHDFYDYLKESWREYQEENDIIDDSNDFIDCGNCGKGDCPNCRID